MAESTNNLIQGPALLYWAPLGSAEPSDGSVHLPPDTGVWTNLGFTRDGVTLQIVQQYSELAVDQLVDVPGRRLTRRDLVVRTNLAEPTLDNLKAALNGGNTNTAAGGSGQSPVETYEPTAIGTGDPGYGMLLFDGLAPSNFARRIIVRKSLQTATVRALYRKDGQTTFSVEFHAHYVDANTPPYKIVDATAVPAA